MSEVSRELADRVLELFRAEDEAGLSALFDPKMKQEVQPDKLRDLWHRARTAAGPVTESGQPVTAELPGGAEMFDYPLRGERRRQHLQVVIRDGMVAGLLVRPGSPTGRWGRSQGMWREVLRLGS